MRPLKLSFGVWLLFITGYGAAVDIHGPLGFRTLDVTPQSWSELNPEYRFKGRVGDTLTFAQIEDIYVLRCYMHVLNNAHVQKTVENAIAPDLIFLSGPVPERLLRRNGPALLTVMFKTRTGVIGLMNIYPEMTILEMNQHYGAVLKEQQ